jgi:hypothetical protein
MHVRVSGSKWFMRAGKWRDSRIEAKAWHGVHVVQPGFQAAASICDAKTSSVKTPPLINLPIKLLPGIATWMSSLALVKARQESKSKSKMRGRSGNGRATPDLNLAASPEVVTPVFIRCLPQSCTHPCSACATSRLLRSHLCIMHIPPAE